MYPYGTTPDQPQPHPAKQNMLRHITEMGESLMQRLNFIKKSSRDLLIDKLALDEQYTLIGKLTVYYFDHQMDNIPWSHDLRCQRIKLKSYVDLPQAEIFTESESVMLKEAAYDINQRLDEDNRRRLQFKRQLDHIVACATTEILAAEDDDVTALERILTETETKLIELNSVLILQ